ncbi:MAG TPA: substrate-binding domain-containing protein [bacterium]
MRLRLSVFLFLVFLLLTGWGHWGPKVKIGLALDNSQDREPLVQKLREAMEENRAELLVKDAKRDTAAQEGQVQDLIRQGIQALVVIPCDASKATSLVNMAHQAGIKVISLERLIPGSDLDYLVGFNNVKAGEVQAQALVRKVPKGRYVLLGGDPAEGVSKDLREGQMNVLQPLIDRGELQIAASRRATAPETPSGASKEMEAILAREKNKVDAVLTSDREAAEGAIRALEKVKLSGKVLVVGLGEDLATCRRIASGSQLMTVYHSSKKLAEETAYLAAKLARKATQFDCQFVEVDNGSKKVQAVLLTPLAVDAKNLDSTVIKDKVQKKEDVYEK